MLYVAPARSIRDRVVARAARLAFEQFTRRERERERERERKERCFALYVYV